MSVSSSNAPAPEDSNLSSRIPTVDCLPPPYTSGVNNSSFYRYQLRRSAYNHRSASTENIISTQDDQDVEEKVCCSRMGCQLCLTACLKFKRIMLLLAATVVACVITSVTLGVARIPKSSHVTLSLMFAGLALLLICVALIGWKCTPQDNEPCHLLFGLGAYSMMQHQNFDREFHRHTGRLYPEFRFRRPPPSYMVSMQEYQETMSNLRRQGLLPQTPPPQYKVSRSLRRNTNNIQFIYPRNPDYPSTAPPQYTRAATSNAGNESVVLEMTEVVPHEPNNTSSSINSNQNEMSLQHQQGIENPTFQEDINNTVTLPELTTNYNVSVDTQSLESTRWTDDDETADNINTCTDFNDSLGEVTHL